MEQQQGAVQSVQRTFAVLETLAASPDGKTIKELCDTLGLAKSTLHRLLANLIALGYVHQSGASARYRATLKMFEIASGIVARTDAVSFAREHLDRLSAETGDAVHLVVPDGRDIVYVYKAEGDLAATSMRMASRVGMRRPMYCTGVGKAILAHLPWAEAKRIWESSDIEALTPKTITDFGVLEKQLAEVRRRGWAMDDEENELGIRCVATALPAAGGGVAAAFSVTGLGAQMDETRVEEIAARCLAVRGDILRDMGLAGL